MLVGKNLIKILAFCRNMCYNVYASCDDMVVGYCCQAFCNNSIENIQNHMTQLFQQHSSCQNNKLAQYVVDRIHLLSYYNIIEH